MNIIETRKLTKYYGEVCGIKDLDLTVNEGEILGFIGPNGAGKSTTVRVLMSLIYPTSGSATIFGKDTVTHGREIRKEVGYLPSEVFFYENMKVKDLLKYSASFYDKDCTQKIKEISSLLKLEMEKKIDDLSYGNKKKVGIVQGLLHRPKLIVLDEPTGGLDPLMQRNFFDLLREERNNGATIFFSSHILSEVQKLCDRVAIIKEGKLIKIESMKDLIQNNFRRFHLTLKEKADKSFFEVEGVNDLSVFNNHVSFLYQGKVNTMAKKILQLDLIDLLVEEPDLEEIFMHYYQ